MIRTCITAATGLMLLFGAGAQAQVDKMQQIDPPRHIEGTVKKVETQNPIMSYLTITVKERVPTDQEDMFREVNKEHRFLVTPFTKILALDSKPEKRGLKALEEDSWVRIEYVEEQAMEVKRLPARGEYLP